MKIFNFENFELLVFRLDFLTHLNFEKFEFGVLSFRNFYRKLFEHNNI